MQLINETRISEPESSGDGSRPLEGVRVLEFGQYAAGPFAGLLLADWGADVVKVEPVGGEGLRAWPPMATSENSDGYSFNFAAINRNKRSVVIDLKDPDGLERAKRMAAHAHIVIENFRPGVMDRLGLGYEALVQFNPRLVYCTVSGYGHTGPYAHKGAFDIAIQGASGIMSVTGDADGPPAKCGVPVADFTSGTFAALSCMVALRKAEQTGKPSRVDVSMLSCMLAISGLQTGEFWGTGSTPRRMGSSHPQNAPYQAFHGADGKWFIVAAGNDRLWSRVCQVVGQPELAADLRFAAQSDRSANQKELAILLQELFRHQTAKWWLDTFDQAQVPSAPVLDYAEALNTSHIRETGLIHSMDLPNGQVIPTVGNPIAMSDYAFTVFRRPALVGEHDAEIDREWLGAGSAA
ncbi:MAG: CoA transferase [Ramlibacter sp.]|nr:CoA transferase [Ramlibacter sp.]